MEQTTEASNPFAGAEVISSYSRAQAIDDGVLCQVDPKLSKEAGFKWPLVVTTAVWDKIVEVPDHPKARGESIEGRLWDIMWMALLAVRAKIQAGEKPDLVPFEVIATDKEGKKPVHKLWLTMSIEQHSEGAAPEPCLTIMYPSDY